MMIQSYKSSNQSYCI